MNTPVVFTTSVNAEDSHKYPDMRLRMIIRQAVLDVTEYNQLTLDETVSILQGEAEYIEQRIKQGVIV